MERVSRLRLGLPNEKQKLFLQSRKKYIAFGGARGGGKSWAVRKGRFVPAHALALSLETFPSRADFPADSREIAAYLRGETLPADRRGWTLVTVDGHGLGWAHGADGVLKNHYPKGLRRKN